MAKIFYSLAGEGRGHATRARVLADRLRERHQVVLLTSEMAHDMLSEVYPPEETDLTGEATARPGHVSVRRIPGLRFHYTDGRVDNYKTIHRGAGYLLRMRSRLVFFEKMLRREQPDIVIGDFEPLLPRAAKRLGIPAIAVDHQQFLVVSDLSCLPWHLRWRSNILAEFVRWWYMGITQSVVSSFYYPPLRPAYAKNTVQTGVLLRQAVLDAQPEDGDHLVTYVRRHMPDPLRRALKATGREVRIYGLGDLPDDGNLRFRSIHEQHFIDDLASAHSLISTAGNQLVGEALYLRKPVLALPEPNNFEQEINGFFLKQTGAGECRSPLTLTAQHVRSFLERREDFRKNIDPDSVRGNERAIAAVEECIEQASQQRVVEADRKRQPRKASRSFWRTNTVSRAVSMLRAINRNRARKPGLPRFLTYTVTFGCNARCIMCDSWKMENKDDLTLDEIERIFDQLPVLDAVRLTGGEPFFRPDFPEIALMAQEKLAPKLLHITSNGFLPKKIMAYLERRPKTCLLDLLISVDGVGDKHNYVRGNSTAWNNVMKTIQAVAPRQRELYVKLAVNQTIVDAEGIEHYKLLREVLRPYGVRNNVVMAYDLSATYNLEREVDIAPTQIGEFCTFGEFTEDHIRQLLQEVEKDLHHYPFLDRLAKRYYMRGIGNRLLGRGGTPNPKCVALNAHMRLFPNGDVPTCQFNSKTVGNLRRQSFSEVWNSVQAGKQRDWVNACPGCWAECEVLPSAVYTGDLIRQWLATSPAKPRGTSAVK